MGSIKDTNGMDLTEAEDIKVGGKNTLKNCTKKILMTQITTLPMASSCDLRAHPGTFFVKILEQMSMVTL